MFVNFVYDTFDLLGWSFHNFLKRYLALVVSENPLFDSLVFFLSLWMIRFPRFLFFGGRRGNRVTFFFRRQAKSRRAPHTRTVKQRQFFY